MVAEKNKVKEIKNIKFLGEEFLTWLGYGVGQILSGLIDLNPVDLGLKVSPKMLSKRMTLTKLHGPTKKLKGTLDDPILVVTNKVEN